MIGEKIMPTRRTFLRNSLSASAALTLGLPGSRGVSAQDAISVEERNKAVVRLFKESQGTPDYPEVLKQVQSPDYRRFRAGFQNLSTNAENSQLADMAEPVRTAFPDRTDTIEQMIAEGDMVAMLFRVKGTHMGNFFGIPATGKTIDIHEIGLLRLADGKITEGWFMADEAGLLQQLGTALPERNDGQRIAPPIVLPRRPGDEVLSELLASPVDTQAYRNKLKVAAYKSVNPPPGILPERPPGTRPYETYTRRGFHYLTEAGIAAGQEEHGMSQAFPDRVDQIANLFSEGDSVLIQFSLTATNKGSLFGIPPSNGPVNAWEVGIMQFEGDHWKTGWWFGDDLGMLLQLGGPQEFLFG
jgi:steroid delta-isomerase-like uncharacterized protein